MSLWQWFALSLSALFLQPLLIDSQAANFSVKVGHAQLNISFGHLVLVLATLPSKWHLAVVDKTTQITLLTESKEEDQKLGFGKWEGEYFDFYYGYLFRLGLVTEWHHATHISKWSTSSNTVSVVVASADPKGTELLVNFTDFRTRQFSMHATLLGRDTNESNRMAIGFLTPEDEGFYGFGERFADCNQRSHRVGSWLEDGSWGLGVFDPDKWKLRVPKGEESTYCPMPIMLSSKGYGLQMDTYYRTVFDLAKEKKDTMRLEQETNTLDLTFFMGRNPRETFSMIIQKNGRSLVPPPWEFSPWNQLGDEVGGVSGLQRIEDLLFKEDVPCSHNINTVHFFPDGGERNNEARLKAENEKMLSWGVKSTCYFNPMLATNYKQLYDVAARNGYLTKNKEGIPYNFSYIAASDFYVSQLDFTNEAAVKWYQEQLQRAVELKFHGWMHDYGEYTPHDSVSSDGTQGLAMHNHYPLLYQKAAFDFLTSLDPVSSDPYSPDFVFYVRSSYVGSQQFTWAHWTGDPSSDWSYASGLPAQITASLNIGLSGMPFSGSDIGGFEWYVDPPPDLELWSRWTAAGSVSGLMHEQGGGKGNGPKTHIFDFPGGTEIWRKFAKLRTQLFPYIYTQAHIAHQTGLPLMQHHLLNFWNDSKAVSQCQQYMFGESLLAAPVVDRGVKEWEVYLPSDGYGKQWLDISSYLQYDSLDGRFRIGYNGYFGEGSTIKVGAPLDTVPLFVRAGHVIPLLDPRVQTLSNASNSSVITWFRMKDLRHAWVFADLDLTASGQTWDGLAYSLRKKGQKLLEMTIQGSPPNTTHIMQLAAPWDVEGLPASVSDGSKELQRFNSWKELVVDVILEGYSYDNAQQVLWIKLLTTSNTITTAIIQMN